MSNTVAIKCKNPKTYNLTKGKEYSAIKVSDGTYTLYNDRGLKADYNKKLFEEVATQLTDQEILNSYGVQDDGTITILGREGNVIRLDYQSIESLGRSRSVCSCGIQEVSHVNNLMESIDDLIHNIGLEDREANTRLLKQIFADHIKGYVNAECVENGAFTMFSTNVDEDEPLQVIIEDVLDSYSDCTAEGDNPNSGNTIKVWVIKNENFDR